MTNNKQDFWSLGAFIDSFIHELDKVQDTLSVKGITRKLTYTVQDVALDLSIFPHYRNKKIRFTMPKPGETGASKISIQLGSISNRLIKENASDPISKDDLPIDEIEEIDEDTRESLKEIGVNSVDDFRKMQAREVNVEKVISDKTEAEDSADVDEIRRKKKKVGYGHLANLINKARRRRLAPTLSRIGVTKSGDYRELSLDGSHLVLSKSFEDFPFALMNNEPVKICKANRRQVQLSIPDTLMHDGSNQLQVALDPFALLTLEIKQ